MQHVCEYESFLHGVGGETWENDTTWEDPGVDRSKILKIDLKYIGLEIVDWIDLAQCRGKLPAGLKTVLKFGVPLKCGKFVG